MKHLIWISTFILFSCNNLGNKNDLQAPPVANSLKQAVMNIQLFRLNQTPTTFFSAKDYYFYLNRESIKSSFMVTDSIKVDNFWLVFYKYTIDGHENFDTDWYMNIKGNYFYSGVYISSYSVDEYFDNTNVSIVKALIEKSDAWKKKSESRWWKYVNN